jgi:hypothetical protein
MSGCYNNKICTKKTKEFLIKFNRLLRDNNMRLIEENVITSTEYGFLGRIEDDLTQLTLLDIYEEVVMETEDD